MNVAASRLTLAQERDFDIGRLRVSPSTCRVFAGQDEMRVEAQTMLALVVLARADGATVSREDLVEACWQGRIVSDDAVARTIAKVRSLARGASPAPFTLETVPKVGYRLVPAGEAAVAPASPRPGARWRLAALVAAAAAVIVVAWSLFPGGAKESRLSAGSAASVPGPRAEEISDALWTLDEPRLRLYLQRGWNPNWLLDSEGNAALHTLMLVCERNPTHDRAGLARVAQFLVSAGANPTTRNEWGDTPLTIAIAPRYCGPDHPVVAFLRPLSAGAASAP